MGRPAREVNALRLPITAKIDVGFAPTSAGPPHGRHRRDAHARNAGGLRSYGTEALTRERIVEAAIGILDAHGEGALTFRALAALLATGSGAIYWHVADKHDLLAAAADHVVGRAMREVGFGRLRSLDARGSTLGLRS